MASDPAYKAGRCFEYSKVQRKKKMGTMYRNLVFKAVILGVAALLVASGSKTKSTIQWADSWESAVDEDGHASRWKINGALLPGQGVAFWWSPREEDKIE